MGENLTITARVDGTADLYGPKREGPIGFLTDMGTKTSCKTDIW